MNINKKDSTSLVHDEVYKKLRDKILYGFLWPGDVLTLRGLASEFCTSVMPVRESVRRLWSEGALKLSASGRISIPTLNSNRFNELIRLRKIIEMELAVKAMPRAHKALIDRLESININMETFANLQEANSYIGANMEFHRTLYLRAQSPIMLSMLETVWLQLSPTIRLGLSDNWNLLDKNEHSSILGALNRNDRENLTALIDKDISICENLFLLF